ncbi:hypothetical protein MKW98_014988, partial [Papaver atlanticum]
MIANYEVAIAWSLSIDLGISTSSKIRLIFREIKSKHKISMGDSNVFVKFQCFIFVFLLLQVASAEVQGNASRPIAKPGCLDRCGNVSIPYPFGIGDGCFINKVFEIKCIIDRLNFTKPMYDQLNVSNISAGDGHMTTSVYVATDCSPGTHVTTNYRNISASFGKFTFSSDKNKFIAIGCDTLAYLGQGVEGYTGTGCMSVCNTMKDISATTDGSCSGIGCCKVSIPGGFNFYKATVESISGTRRNLSFNPCSYAFLVEENWFKFSPSYLKDFQNYGTGEVPVMVPVVVDWTIGNETCDVAKINQTSYACGPNTNCKSSNNSLGYRCNCLIGYEGNPYLNSTTGGECQDIDECDKKLYDNPCGAGRNCLNTNGGHTCPCKKGYKENGAECILPSKIVA